MKRQLVFLMFAMFLVTGTIIPAVFADAALTTERFRATGNYDIAAAGVGLQGETSGQITLNIPNSDTSVVAAYLYWAGFDSISGGDAEVDFEGTQVTVLDVFGPDLWYDDNYCYVYVADVTSDVQPEDSTYTIDGVEFDRNFGAGIIVVYQNDALPLAEVIVLDGLDIFWFGWPDPRGPNSEVTSFAFDSSVISRTAEMTLLAGGTEHDDRPNKIWTETGPNPAPLPDEDLIDVASTADGNYPLVGSDGPSWDTYTTDVSVAAGDEWAAVQVESIDTGNVGAESPYYGRGSSGFLVAGGFVLPMPTLLEGLSPGFWKHNIAVYLGYNPGRYSVPHEGEARMDGSTLETYLALIGKTAEEAYDALTAKGKGSASIRLDMANSLNAAAGYTPYSD